MHNHGGEEKQKQGISSYHMQDPKNLFDKLEISNGMTVADIGCGAGDYSLHAATLVGEDGEVLAVDRWDELEQLLTEKAEEHSLGNIKYQIGNMLQPPLPLATHYADQCIMANVLHGINLAEHGATIFNEIRRILKPGGKLNIIEFGQTETTFGPPMEIRLTPEALRKVTEQYGFSFTKLYDLGTNYLLVLKT